MDVASATSVTVSASVSGQCGNNIVEPGEQCDGTSLDGKTCSDFNFATGTLACSNLCSFELTQCSDPTQVVEPPVPTPVVQTGSTGGGSVSPFANNSSIVVFSGTAEIGSTIQLLKDETVIGQTIASSKSFFQISANGVVVGTYTYTLRVKDKNGVVQNSLNFPIIVSGNSTINISDINTVKTDVEPKKVCIQSDLNCDGIVDIKDISLMQYWYKKDNPPAAVDLNKDKKVTIDDVALMFSENEKTDKKGLRKAKIYAEFPDSEHLSLGVGQTFSVQVVLDPQDETIFALDSNITYPSNILKLKRIEIGNSILGFVFDKPVSQVSNNIGSINLSGAMPGGFGGYIKPATYPHLEPGKIITLIFETLSSGDGSISISTNLFKNNELGQNNEKQVELVPFSVKKYSSYIEDANKDVTPPDISFVELSKDEKIEGKPYVTFRASDDISGVDYYEININNRWASATSPYLINGTIPDSIKIKAVDLAGNSSIKEVVLNSKKGMSEDYKKVVQVSFLLLVIGILVVLGRFMMLAL